MSRVLFEVVVLLFVLEEALSVVRQKMSDSEPSKNQKKEREFVREGLLLRV
jgi:hypothetical protein